jgi:hypothetical protein
VRIAKGGKLMSKNSNAKKIEKLQSKINEIDERVKNDLQQKQECIKEIQALEADSILCACKSSNITVSEAMATFELYNKIKQNGLSIDDVSELLDEQSDKSEQRNPMDYETSKEEKKDEK